MYTVHIPAAPAFHEFEFEAAEVHFMLKETAQKYARAATESLSLPDGAVKITYEA